MECFMKKIFFGLSFAFCVTTMMVGNLYSAERGFYPIQANDKIQVSIFFSDGTFLGLTVPSNATIEELKKLICEKRGINPAMQCLKRDELADDLEDYETVAESEKDTLVYLYLTVDR